MFKKGDLLVLAAAAALFVAVSLLVLGPSRGGRAMVRIRWRDGEAVYPLDEDRTVEVPGPLGVSVIEIRDRIARFVSSPCPNGLCQAGSAGEKGGTLVCMPNLVSVRVEGGGEVDDVAY